MSGKGTIYSFIVVRHPFFPAVMEEEGNPYISAMVELDEQKDLRIIAIIQGCQPEDAYIGMPVEVTFEDLNPEVTIANFKPAPGAIKEEAKQ